MEKKLEGTIVIEIELKPETDMTVTCDCVGILKVSESNTRRFRYVNADLIECVNGLEIVNTGLSYILNYLSIF